METTLRQGFGCSSLLLALAAGVLTFRPIAHAPGTWLVLVPILATVAFCLGIVAVRAEEDLTAQFLGRVGGAMSALLLMAFPATVLFHVVRVAAFD